MQAIVGHLREMSDENQDEILTQFLSDYCDSDVWDTFERPGKCRYSIRIKRVYPNVDYTTLRREEKCQNADGIMSCSEIISRDIKRQ